MKLWHLVFYVTQQNNKEWVFHEADFPNLKFEDLDFMYNDFRERMNRVEAFTMGLQAVKRFMVIK